MYVDEEQVFHRTLSTRFTAGEMLKAIVRCAFDQDDDHLAFADIWSPGTIENLLINPAIEINVVDVFIRKGYRFKGSAKVLSDGETFMDVLSFYGEAASKYQINNIVLVKVERVLPVTSPIYDTGLSEEEVKDKYIAYWNSVYPK